MRMVVLVSVLMLGCRATVPVVESGPGLELVPTASAALARPAVGIWFEGEELLVLEASGTRILRFDSTLTAAETIPLTTRLVGPRGICSDRNYIYVYDSNTLFRMDKGNMVLSVWLNNLRVAGTASFAPTEMLVADADRGVIWYKGFFGESRQFVPSGTVRRPGAMAALGDVGYCVVSDGRELVMLNRLGMVNRSLPLPAGTDLLAADGRGRVWVGRTGIAEVTGIAVGAGAGRWRQRYRLADAASPTQLVAGSRLAVLDAGNRIFVYDLP